MSKYLIENLFDIEGWNIAWYGVIIALQNAAGTGSCCMSGKARRHPQ